MKANKGILWLEVWSGVCNSHEGKQKYLMVGGLIKCLLLSWRWTIGWPLARGWSQSDKKKKIQIVFLPLMAPGNESPKEFWFRVPEDLSQDLGFRSIICVTPHVTLRKLLAHYRKIPPKTLPAIQFKSTMLNCEQFSTPICKKDLLINCWPEFLQNHMRNHTDYEPKTHVLREVFYHSTSKFLQGSIS